MSNPDAFDELRAELQCIPETECVEADEVASIARVPAVYDLLALIEAGASNDVRVVPQIDDYFESAVVLSETALRGTVKAAREYIRSEVLDEVTEPVPESTDDFELPRAAGMARGSTAGS